VAELQAIFKAYDIRGLVPSQLDAAAAHAIGAAFVDEVHRSARSSTWAVVIGHDMRDSSPELAEAFADGARAAGAEAVMIGLASSDQLYFASGHLDLPGAMITASHNPAAYNGIKLCRAGAVALSAATGLDTIRTQAQLLLEIGATHDAARRPGGRVARDVVDAYAEHLRRLAPVRGRRLKVAVDAGNGMAGHTVPHVLGPLDLELVPLYFELDGSFPNHEANPLDPANLRDLQAAVLDAGCDLGLAFDGDADRCFVVDERGEPISPSALTSLIAVRTLEAEPGATIIHNLITSRAVPELVRRHGGRPVRTKVGHSLIKATMAEQQAAFGGEHSGHFYFRDFWFADSGMLAALHLLGALAETTGPVSQLVADYQPYAASGEVNVVVDDAADVIARLGMAYAGRDGVVLDHLDGLTVSADDWWFNVRPSNTEPMLRVNAEGTSASIMVEVRDAVLHTIDAISPNVATNHTAKETP